MLGWLFKSRNKKSTQTNLFIFITPKVIRNAADLADLTREKTARTVKRVWAMTASACRS
ncbi:MAG: hypothetical protein ACLR0N_11480 [Bilophila wadsworthia]